MTYTDYLHAEKILELEFGYAKDCAHNAEERRDDLFKFYLILGSSILPAANTLAQFQKLNDSALGTGLSLVFALIGCVGFFTLMRIVRLRQAWYESVHAMNTIKKFYLDRYPELDAAFDWKVGLIPALGKPWTVTFNLALLVAVVDSAAIAVAFHFADQYFANADTVAMFAAALFFLWQIWFYFFQLPPTNK